jgi:hypothetical protein
VDLPASCRVCGRPVLGLPWHDTDDHTAHQACVVGAGGRWALSEDFVATGPGGRHVTLSWARLRTIAVGNLEVPLTRQLRWRVGEGATGSPKLGPLLEGLDALGLGAAIVSPVDVLTALIAVQDIGDGVATVRVAVPWVVPAEVSALANQRYGRGRPRRGAAE